jgi:hypothetical protein
MLTGLTSPRKLKPSPSASTGASLRTSYHLALDQEVSIRTKVKDRVGQLQVVWIGAPGTPDEGKIGVEWLEPRRFWGVEFPPEDWQSE